jgi:NADH:ubiquinone oxidoreductase subunit K
MVMTVGAAETALGLAILIVYYKLRGGISADLISKLKS